MPAKLRGNAPQRYGVKLDAPLKLLLEVALECSDLDEFSEATSENFRLGKKRLDQTKRKRSAKSRAIRFVEQRSRPEEENCK